MKLDIENLEQLKQFSNKKKFRNKHPLLPQFPFNMLIIGPTGCGKGVLLLNLILKFITFDKLYLYSKHIDQPQVQMLISFFNKIKEQTSEDILYVSNDIEDVVSVDDVDSSLQNLIIFDDMILENNLNQVVNFFIRGRHSTCSTIMISQIYMKVPRSIRLNTHYIALFKIPNRREQQIIYGEIGYGLNRNEFKTYFQKAIKEPFDFFFVDTRAKMKQLMYRKNFNYVLVEN